MYTYKELTPPNEEKSESCDFNFLFGIWATPANAQELHLALLLKITPEELLLKMLRGSYSRVGMVTRSAT